MFQGIGIELGKDAVQLSGKRSQAMDFLQQLQQLETRYIRWAIVLEVGA